MLYQPTKTVYACGHSSGCSQPYGDIFITYTDELCDLCRALKSDKKPSTKFVFECKHTIGPDDAPIIQYLHGMCANCKTEAMDSIKKFINNMRKKCS